MGGLEFMKSLFAILLFFSFLIPKDARAEEQDVKLAEFEGWLAEYRAERVIPSFSVAVIKNQEVIFSKGFGFSDDEGDRPTTPDTTYFIASVTKPLAAVAFLRADEMGLLSLDIPLNQSLGWDGFCEWFPTSGIIFAGGVLDNGDVIGDFDCGQPITLTDGLNHRVNGTPGESFAYNPLVYARLGRLFPALTETTFRDVLRESVIDAAGMENTAAGWHDPDGGRALTNLAPPFKIKEDGNIEKVALPDDDIRAAAGIYSSVLDIAKFDIALDQGKLLTPETMEKMWTPALDDAGTPFAYTYGWFYQEFEGMTLYWHSGWQPDAYSALYLKVPELNLTLIALGNSEGIWWGNSLTRAEVDKSTLAAKFLELFTRAE